MNVGCGNHFVRQGSREVIPGSCDVRADFLPRNNYFIVIVPHTYLHHTHTLQYKRKINVLDKQSSMDIDDILAEVSGDGIPLETRDLQELTRAWVTERSAPELLPWPSDLMERVLRRIHQQASQRSPG